MYSSLNSFNSLVTYGKAPDVPLVGPETPLSIAPGAIFTNTAWTKMNTNWALGGRTALSMSGVMDMNADGSKVYTYYGNNLSISTDGGANWRALLSIGDSQSSVCVSENGQYFLVAWPTYYVNNYTCYQSNNYGVTWTNNLSFTYNNFVTTVGMSSNGKYRLVPVGGSDAFGNVKTGYVYVSNDYGATYSIPSALSSLNKRWLAAGVSKDGSMMWVGNYETYLYKSTDYGVNWVYVNIPGSTPDVYSETASTSPSVYANKIAISTSNYVVALTTNTAYCVSTDSGNTWKVRASGFCTNYNNGTGQQYRSFGFTMRSDGQVIVSCNYSNYGNSDVYYSTNFGNSWHLYSLNNNLQASNLYGCAQFGISWNGNVIYAGEIAQRGKCFKRITTS
jgi:hypothetical protein